MAVLINQFSQTVTKGQPDLYFQPNTIPCSVKSDESTALVPGQAVKLVDTAGGVPIVTAVTANTDDIFGIVGYNIKNATFPAGSYVEIYAQGDVVYLESGAAIARGAKVQYTVTGELVATATAGKSIVGIALDKATAANQLIRIYLLTFSGASDVNFTPATNVAASSYTTVANIALSTANTYTDAAVNAAVNTAIGNVNTALTAIQTTLNAEIAALKTAGLQLSA